MSSSKRSPSSIIPFKSKKTLRSTSKPSLPDQKSSSSQMREKDAQLPRRARNRKVVFSINEIRRAAGTRESNRQPPDDRMDESKSVRDSGKNGSPSSRSEGSTHKRKQLPEKFEMLNKFFESLVYVIRLNRLRGVASTFSNVRPGIQALTARSFSYDHLAQLKFILPEAIEIKKSVVIDERTSTMKPDLHISFNYSVLDSQGNLETEFLNIHLRKLFHTRLSEFVSSHQEIDEVPKELLPEPFNPSSQPTISSTNVTDKIPFNGLEQGLDLSVNAAGTSMPPTRIVTDRCDEEKFMGASHLPRSFSRYFSKKRICRESERTELAMNPHRQDSSHSTAGTQTKAVDADVESLSIASTHAKLSSNPTFASPRCLLALQGAPKEFMTDEAGSSASPAKLVSTPVKLAISTPAMPPPKRSYMSPDSDGDSKCPPSKLVRRSSSRSLIFSSPTKKEHQIDVMESSSLDNDILNTLPESLLQSIREKELKAKEEQMPAISQAKRRQQMIGNLPKLFNAIFYLFNKRTVIIKEELIHKVLAGHSDIVDKREVEEQLNLLLELVPEWISEKKASSGDLLLCINKLSSAEPIRARLEGAK